MRKADYLTLAKTLRVEVCKWSPTDGPILGESHYEYEGRKALSFQAVSMARYLHQHLAMPSDIKAQFLELCGVRPLP